MKGRIEMGETTGGGIMSATLQVLKRTQIRRRGDICIELQITAVTETPHHDFTRPTTCAIVAASQLATRPRSRGNVGSVATVMNKRKARDSNPPLPEGRAA